MGGNINNALKQKDNVNILYMEVQLNFKISPRYRRSLQVIWEAVVARGTSQARVCAEGVYLHLLLSQGYNSVPTCCSCLSPTLLTPLSSKAYRTCILVSHVFGASAADHLN